MQTKWFIIDRYKIIYFQKFINNMIYFNILQFDTTKIESKINSN